MTHQPNERITSPLRIAVAQIIPVKGNIEVNRMHHIRLANLAADQEADLILFPELSLTGYEPELAAALAFSSPYAELQPLATLARERKMYIIAGGPLKGNDQDNQVHIAAFVFIPDGAIQVYTKNQLHPGEEKYFFPGMGRLSIHLKGEHLAVAVCADFTNTAHTASYAAEGCTIYLASVLISSGGIANDFPLLQGIAEKQGMLVMMANFAGTSGGYTCGGQTAVWAPGGMLLGQMDNTSEGLLFCTKKAGEWIVQEPLPV